jgi:hypothetical protein
MAQRSKSYVAKSVVVTGPKPAKKVAETPITVPKVITSKDLEFDTATASSSDFKDRTDPKYVGPGTWNTIHQRAYKARTHEEQVDFIRFMKDTCHEFPCSICRGHCTKYIQDNPMEDYLDVAVEVDGTKQQLGMFLWSWKFHNTVNNRLRKPIMSWATAVSMYGGHDTGVCSKNCTDADHAEPEPSKPKNFTPIPPKPFKLVSSRK